MSLIDEIVAGSIDMHVHNGPDALLERRADAVQLARYGEQLGMRAIVLKNRNYCTCGVADLANQLVSGLRMVGSLCLDYECGGINVSAVEAAGRMGARVIWMPTFSSKNSKFKPAGVAATGSGAAGIDLLDESTLGATRAVLSVIKKYNMILATGHVSPREIYVLMTEAERIGLKKIILTHPLSRGAVIEILSVDEQKELAARGAFIEFCFLDVMPPSCEVECAEIAATVRSIGAEHCILSTDFGQVHCPPAPEGLRLFIASMLKCGLSRSEVELMVKKNPAALLGLA
jgi:hypothetical protein